MGASKKSAPHKKELEFCEEKIMQIEELLEEQNANLTEASNQGNNSAMIEHAQVVGKSHQAIDELFERLEVASDRLDEIALERLG